MRTQDPTKIREEFFRELDQIAGAFSATERGLTDDQPRKLIAEYLFVAAAALVEGFISDLFVAYINRDSSAFRQHILGRVSAETTDPVAKRALSDVSMNLPHLTVDRIREILDPNDYNITFSTTDKMKEAAGTWLASNDKARIVGISVPQARFVDYLKAVRNFLAHGSQASNDSMQAILSNSDLPAELRRGPNGVADIGAYLRASQSGKQRFVHCIDQIKALVVQLCP